MTGQEKKIKISELPASVSFTGLWTVGYQNVDGKKTSVRVSLSEIKGAYDDAMAAAAAAQQATKDMRQLEATVEGNEEVRENFYSSSQALVQGWSNDELARKEAEAIRVGTENQRIQDEQERIAAEATRKENEAARIVEEVLREKSEATRKENEAIRQQQEEAREQGTIEAILNTEAAADRLNALSDHRDEIRAGYWWRWNEDTGEWYNTGEVAKGNAMFATFEVNPATAILTMYTDEEYTGANFTLDENGVLSVEI